MTSPPIRLARALMVTVLVAASSTVGCSSDADPSPAGGAGGGGSGGSSGGGQSGTGGGTAGASGGLGDGGASGAGGASGGAGANGGASGGGVAGASGGTMGTGGAGGGPDPAADAGSRVDAGQGGVDASAGDSAARDANASGSDAASGAFTVSTPAFMNQPGCGPAAMATACATFPRNNTNYGTNVSPAMSWMGAPAATQSFAVVLQDLTNGNAHWVLWNIPTTVTMLAENVPKDSAMPAMPAGAQQASLGAGDGYFGPGACGNVYEFVVYALAVPSFAPTAPTNQTMVRAQLQALGNGILGTASMRARSFAPNCP